MKKKLICAAMFGALVPAPLLAQGLESGVRTSAMFYWQVPLDAAKAGENRASFGLRLQSTPVNLPVSISLPPPPPRETR